MLQLDRSVLKKNIALSALGVSLQVAGSLCLIAAAVGAVKAVNRQIKKAIAQELSRQIAKDCH